jgi:cytoskeletal protein RodZ
MSNSIPGGDFAPPPQRKSWGPIALVAALLLGVGILLWFVPALRASLEGDEDTTAAAPPASSVAVAPVQTPTVVEAPRAVDASPAEVDIEIKTEPSDARIFFDGAELATNPSIRRVSKGDKVHKIRAEAKGYEAREVEVTADKDIVVTVALERTRSAAVYGGPKPPREEPKAPVKPPETGAPPPPPPTTTKEPSARDRIRNLDKSNPWEQ